MDLNPTAVELARVSLWLNVIYEGAEVPWFGPRLAVGNSLIGARRQVYGADDVKSGAYREKPARPLAPDGAATAGRQRLPLAAARRGHGRLRRRQGDRRAGPRCGQGHQGVAQGLHGQDHRRRVGDPASPLRPRRRRCGPPTWPSAAASWRRHGRKSPCGGSRGQGSGIRDQGQCALTIADRERIFATLSRPTSPYRRLKLALDYWCSLWFWPIPEAGKLPSRSEFLNEMAEIFAGSGEEPDFDRPAIQFDLFPEAAPPRQTSFGELRPVSADMLKDAFPRLRLADEIAAAQRFHHWELAFPEVFADNGGFDLTAGEPTLGVGSSCDEAGLLSDYDPLIAVRKMSASEIAEQRPAQLDTERVVRKPTLRNSSRQRRQELPERDGQLPAAGGQAEPLQVLRDPLLGDRLTGRHRRIPASGGAVRRSKGWRASSQAYLRLRAHFQFHNELKLFADVHHQTKYSVNVYAANTADRLHIRPHCQSVPSRHG